MDVSAPIRAVLPSSHGPVLTVLARAGQPLTGRRIADLTHPSVSQKQTSTVLSSLAAHGLVTVTHAGSSNLYSLNRDHLAADAITQLTTLRERLWDRILGHVATWAHQPDALVVFGSTARGDGGVDSDIDILVVRPETVLDSDSAWQEDLTRFAVQITTWTGNGVDLLDMSPADLSAMAAAGEALLSNIRSEGRFLIGAPHVVPVPEEG